MELNELIDQANAKLQEAINKLYAEVESQYGPEARGLFKPVLEMPPLTWHATDEAANSVTVKLVPRDDISTGGGG